MPENAILVILNEVKNLKIPTTTGSEILRLKPQNDITTQPFEGGEIKRMPFVPALNGGAFWHDFVKGIQTAIEAVEKLASERLMENGHPAAFPAGRNWGPAPTLPSPSRGRVGVGSPSEARTNPEE